MQTLTSSLVPATAGRVAPRTIVVPLSQQHTDASIRRSLLQVLESHRSWHAETANVFVQRGVVMLQGLFHSEAERRHACEAAMRIPGVQRVEDMRVKAAQWQAMA